MTGSVRVQVPATSANLGPGYDCAGLALGMADTLEATLLDAGGLEVEVEGEGAQTVPKDDSHLVVRAMARGFAEAGRQIPGLRLKCVNVIPHGRGLGSSSAAIVGGLLLARELMADGQVVLSDERLLALATELEGHPDNVAPALLGGLTIAWTATTAGIDVGRAIRVRPNPRLQPVVAIPAAPLATERARELLPATVPHSDAAANAGRAALLVPALTTHLELLLEATRDLLHQDYRRFAYPQSHALVASLRGSGIPAMISGAGPTVIALGVADTQFDGLAVQAEMSKALAVLGPTVASEFVVEQLTVADHGARAI